MSHSLPHLSLSPASPFFPTISQTHTRHLVDDEHLPCNVPRQSGESTQIPSLTGYEPIVIETKVIETNVIDTEAIEPEDLEPRRIELDRHLGTDPYQIQERFMRNNYQNPIAEDLDEFGEVGAEMSHLQSQMHSARQEYWDRSVSNTREMTIKILSQRIRRRLEILMSTCLTSHQAYTLTTIQRKALQTRILKMENYEKCWLHHCIDNIEKVVNHLEHQLHRGNLLQ